MEIGEFLKRQIDSKALPLFFFVLFFLSFFPISGAIGQDRRIDPVECVDCHPDFDAEVFKQSIHGEMDCVDCHTEGPFGEHEEAPPKVQCQECHEDPVTETAASVHGKSRMAGHMDAPSCYDCHGDAHAIVSSSDPKAKHYRGNIPAMCAQCHADVKITKKYDMIVKNPLELYQNSVHGRALAAGNLEAAVCSDCHGAHNILAGTQADSKVWKMHVPETCGECHQEIFKEFATSVHGEAIAKGILDAPSCSDCHGEHGILPPEDPESSVSPSQVATKTCAHCHESLTLAQRYGFSIAQVKTYSDSYHGLAIRRGAATVANCGSCHGIHNIKASTNPDSTIHPSNLQETCGKCHPGATEAFTKVPVHLQTSPTANPILYYVRIGYIGLILATILFMLAHNLLIVVSAICTKYRHEKKGTTYRRYSYIQLISHAMLFTSFATLVVTGFGLYYSASGWTIVLDLLRIDEDARQFLHRAAAIVMLGAGGIHIVYSAFTRHGKYDFLAFWPRWRDVREFVQNVRYYLQKLRTDEPKTPKPKMDRYSYIEKIEYWALIWGTIVMTVTGFALWFPEVASRFLPAVWGLPLMEMIHFYEAWLATLAIVVWHFFFVIFHPDEYPMSLIWLTGRVTKHEMEDKHPDEMDKIIEPQSPQADDPVKGPVSDESE